MKHIGNIYSETAKEIILSLSKDNPGDYGKSVIELGTYLPLKQQIEQMKKSGTNLSAIRQALHDFESGVPDWRLEHIDDTDFIDQIGADAAELLTKKRSILAELEYRKSLQAQISAEELKKAEEQKKLEERQMFEKWVQAQKAQVAVPTADEPQG